MKTQKVIQTAAVMMVVLAIAGISNGALIAYYDFGVTSPTAANMGTVGSVADGVLMNGATIVDIDTTSRGVEWALKLDATAGHQYMNISNGNDWFSSVVSGGHGPFSVAAWVRQEECTTATWNTFISKGYDSAFYVGTGTPYGYGINKLVFSYPEAIVVSDPLKSDIAVRRTLSTYCWTHVVATIDGDDYKTASLYVNGVLAESRQTWGSLNSNTEDILIGEDPVMAAAGYDYQWNGMIDDVRIYDQHIDAQGAMDLFVNTFSWLYTCGIGPSWVVSVEITGPEKVAEGDEAQYAAIACIQHEGELDCCDVDVTSEVACWWVVPDTNASVDANGLLTVGNIDTSEGITIYAEYSLIASEVGEIEVDLCGTADLNNDDKIDLGDYAILAEQWLEEPGTPSADLSPFCSGDGIVDINDLGLLVDDWVEEMGFP